MTQLNETYTFDDALIFLNSNNIFQTKCKNGNTMITSLIYLIVLLKDNKVFKTIKQDSKQNFNINNNLFKMN